MGSRDTFATACANVFSKKGESAVYTPAAGVPVPCKVFIEFNVLLQPSGAETQVWQRGTTIEAVLSDLADVGIGTTEPNRGDTFTLGGTTYTVQAITENDGFTVVMVVT